MLRQSTRCRSTYTSYFALPQQPLDPEQGYVFSHSETRSDFQIFKDAPEIKKLFGFRITINENLEWTLVDETLNGITLNGISLCSGDARRMLILSSCHRPPPVSERPLRVNQPNWIEIGSSLYLILYVLRQPTRCAIQSLPSDPPLSPTLSQSSPYVASAHRLTTTEDIDAELHRQTGGDLTRGVYIDSARTATGPGEVETEAEIDDSEWTVLTPCNSRDEEEEVGGGTVE